MLVALVIPSDLTISIRFTRVDMPNKWHSFWLFLSSFMLPLLYQNNNTRTVLVFLLFSTKVQCTIYGDRLIFHRDCFISKNHFVNGTCAIAEKRKKNRPTTMQPAEEIICFLAWTMIRTPSFWCLNNNNHTISHMFAHSLKSCRKFQFYRMFKMLYVCIRTRATT